MSIREKRLSKAINEILRKELQKGNLPSSREFIWSLNQYLQSTNINGPQFKFKLARRGSVAKSSYINEIFESIYKDFEILYANIVDQHNNLTNHFNKYDVEKAKLEYEITNLEEKLKELILLYSEEGFVNSVYDIFTDFSQIDMQKTTAAVDITTHEVKISNIKSRSFKISPDAIVGFEILPEIKSAVEGKTISGNPEDALSDKANTTWQYEMTSNKKMDVGGYYTVAFNGRQEINKISLSLHLIKPVYVKVEISPDAINWVSLPYYESGVTVSGDYTFDFPSMEVYAVRFLLGKSEPDHQSIGEKIEEASTQVEGQSSEKFLPKQNKYSEPDSRRYGSSTSGSSTQGGNNTQQWAGSIRYTYLFGIKNISFFYNTYANENTLVSNELVVENPSGKNFTIDKVSLLVDEELPNGTDIEYYIALPPAQGEPEWKPISPVNRENPKHEQIIDYKNISTAIPTVLRVDPEISIGEYEQENLYANGIKFYKIGEITDRQIIDGTDKLFVGRNTWGKKFYEKEQSNSDSHIPNLNDWRTPKGVKASFAKIEDGKPGLLLNKERTSVPTNYMFTLGVFSNNEKEVVTAVPASTDPIAIFMNGELLFEGIPDGSAKVTYLFENKWNEIVVLIYTSKTAGTVNGATVDLNIDPRKYGANVYSKTRPLTKVSIFDLRYNVNASDMEKYAIVEVNNRSQVILNHVIPGLEYDFYYNYIDGSVQDKILFKAVLKRDDAITNASPKLKSYRLRFS